MQCSAQYQSWKWIYFVTFIIQHKRFKVSFFLCKITNLLIYSYKLITPINIFPVCVLDNKKDIFQNCIFSYPVTNFITTNKIASLFYIIHNYTLRIFTKFWRHYIARILLYCFSELYHLYHRSDIFRYNPLEKQPLTPHLTVLKFP